MSKRQLRKVPIWKLTLRFGSIFIIVVGIIQLLLQLINNGNLNKVSESFENGDWGQYAFTMLLVGLVYGVTTAFIMKNNLKQK